MKDARSLVCSFVRSGSRSFAPTVHSCFAAARRRRQGRRSRKPRHNVRLRKAAPWMVASTAAGLHGSGRRRSDDRATPSWSPAMLSTPSQLCAHGCIVPSSRSGLLYNMGEWERERPSHAVTAAPSNCVNGLTRLFATPAHMPPPFDLRLDSAGLTILEKELAHGNISPALRQVKRREVSDCCLPLVVAEKTQSTASALETSISMITPCNGSFRCPHRSGRGWRTRRRSARRASSH